MDKKYLKQLEFDKVLNFISDCAKTAPGKAAALEITPLNIKSEIEFSLNLTTDAKALLDEFGVNSLPLLFASDPDKILTSARLSIDDIIDLAKMLTSSRRVKNFLSKKTELLNNTYAGALLSEKGLEDKIYGIFDENCNIKDDATHELKRLKISLNAQYSNLHTAIGNLLKDPVFKGHLQDTICTERTGRTVFQVKAADKSKVKGIVHDVSASRQTFFIEPEALVELNNKIRQTECDIEAEIERILYGLSLEFHKIKRELILAYRAIVELDVIFAKAKYSILTKSAAPVICEDKIIKLFSAAHPLLIGSEKLVRNDFEIGETYKSLLITGSNTGGKTVMMKTAGLAVLMTKAGIHVMAEYAEIYPFKNVFSDIEEKQDITQSLSTFSAHIKNIANIINNIGSEDFVLFDELGVGTDPTEGASLAKSILEYLAKKDVITVSTTHLGELKILEYENDYFKNACVEFDKETMMPTYKLIIGIAGNSYAIDAANNYGLNKEIIEKARENLNKNSNPATRIFNKIQTTHQELLNHAKKIEETKISAAKKEEELGEKLKEIKENKKKTLDSFKKKFQGNFEAARGEIKSILEELRKEKSEKNAKRAYSKVAKLEEAAHAEFAKDEDELTGKYPPVEWNEIQIGHSILVKGINQPAVLKSFPDGKGIVEIQIGLIKSKIHKSKLAKTERKVNKSIKKTAVSFDDFHVNASFTQRLDLRGMRTHEALDALEHHLDLAVRRNISQFTVIHGHGTGALKKAIRKYLNESPYVLKFRPGADTEGGDGVCIIDVK